MWGPSFLERKQEASPPGLALESGFLCGGLRGLEVGAGLQRGQLGLGLGEDGGTGLLHEKIVLVLVFLIVLSFRKRA